VIVALVSLLLLACALGTWRLSQGPTREDRVLGFLAASLPLPALIALGAAPHPATIGAALLLSVTAIVIALGAAKAIARRSFQPPFPNFPAPRFAPTALDQEAAP